VARKFASKLIKTVVEAAEARFKTPVITFESSFDNPKRLTSPGGQCSCCGLSPNIESEDDWWLVFKAGLADSDGVYYSMLCDNPSRDGCLSDIRRANDKRTPTMRDEAAALVSDLMGDDVDGAEAFMEDLDFLGGFEDDE
jgi:hypothetical protein